MNPDTYECGPIDVVSYLPSSPSAGTWVPPQSSPRDAAYSAGRVTKLNRSWNPQTISGDVAIKQSMDVLNARARDLVRNDAVLRKIVKASVALNIGAGMQTFSSATDVGGEFLEDFAEESNQEFQDWAIEEADAIGRMTLWDMQRLSFSDMGTVGLSIWLEVLDNTPGRRSPLSYQLLEYEQLDRSKDRTASRGKTQIVNGLELDNRGRVIAAWLFDSHPNDLTDFSSFLKSRRIRADRLIINLLPDRPSSHLGISWFSSLVQVARDRDRLMANVLTTANLQSLMAVLAKTECTNFAEGFTGKDEYGNTNFELGYPSLITVKPGENVEIIESNRKDADVTALFRTLHLHSAMGAGMSLSRLTGDASEGSFASVKAAILDDERINTPVQQHQMYLVALPIRQRHNEIAAALGLYQSVTPNEFQRQRRRLQRFSIIPAGDPDVQPKEDGEAAIDRMRSGRTTYAQECGRLGFDWREQIKVMAEVNRVAEKAGVILDFTKGQGGTLLGSSTSVEAVNTEMEKTDA